MTKFKQISAILICVFLFSQVAAQQDRFSIVANFTDFKDSTKVYLLNLDSTTQFDSAYLISGKVKFEGHFTEPSVFRLYTFLDNELFYFNFWVDKKFITISGSRNNFSESRVVGSPLTDIALSVDGKHTILDKLRDNLVTLAIDEKNEDVSNGILKSISELDKQVLKIRIETIATFKPSLVTIKELFFVRNDLSSDSLQLLFDKFPIELKKTKYGEIIRIYLATQDIKVGSSFSDLIGTDLNGKIMKLSDFKNKLILLDFWASWCGPCRFSNKDLAKLYEKYHSAGFEIFSFSLDTNPDSWRKASQKDGIVWTNISDLKGYYSEQAASYKVRAIPKSFLIDKDGIIVKIFTGFSKDGLTLIENKIQETTK